MQKLTLATAIFIAALAANVHTVSAHQPQYVGTETAVHIPDAETSRAYYGELAGQPAVYTVSSPTEFSLYINILAPYLPGAQKDFSVRVTDAAGSVVADLQAPASDWQKWYEEFAGDIYWKGPEFKATVPAGTYTLVVSNPSNRGKYVLAPGEAEVFTLTGTPSTVRQLYEVKTHFFGKSGFSIFEGIIGKVLLGIVAVCVVVVGVVGALLLRRRRMKI